MIDHYSVTKLTEHMKTACVGRFLVDLPEPMEFSYSHAFVDGLWISAQDESQQAFEARVLARRKEIEAEPNQLGKNNLEQTEDYENNGFSGKIFVFGRNITKGLEHGRPVEWAGVKLEAYVHAHGTSFNFKADDYDPDQTASLRKLIDKLRLVPPKDIPTAAGFCFGPGMFIDPLPADLTEGVTLFAGLPDHPDLAMALDTRAGLEPDQEGRIARNARIDAEMPSWQRPLLTKIRKGKRTINGIEGEEVLEGGRELNFVEVYLLDWEVNGTKDNVFIPFMHLEMSTGHPVHAGARPVSSFLNEDALVQLWDKISSTIRVRPSGTPAPNRADPPPSGSKPGATASAGDICPETGWWQCGPGADRAGGAGGQRQFLKKGQPMPQALALQPHTLWAKLRGGRSRLWQAQPTGWTLVDRRSRARVAPAVRLAAANPVASPVAGNDVLPGGGPLGAGAAVGSVAATGLPCPASGWWRCEDAQALDGTRWFAQGASLPPATFERGSIFQRRSRWQLVRQTQGPDREAAAS